MPDLEAQLKQENNARIKLIVTDGVFSMDGNISPLDKICKLADQYGALVFVDEAHATGFLGRTGRCVFFFLNAILILNMNPTSNSVFMRLCVYTAVRITENNMVLIEIKL